MFWLVAFLTISIIGLIVSIIEKRKRAVTEQNRLNELEKQNADLEISRLNQITPSNICINNNEFMVHSDLNGLLWIVDGPKKNYSPEVTDEVFFDVGIYHIRFVFGMSREPSAISVNMAVTQTTADEEVESPPYFPRYDGLTPKQRWLYWQTLANPYADHDIGYIFLLYYGLERHLLIGDIDRAVDVILKLRDRYTNQSFQEYSSTALVYSAVTRNRPDLLKRISDSIDKEHEEQMSIMCFIALKMAQQEDIAPHELMRYAKQFGFTNTRYIKMHPSEFEISLADSMKDTYGTEALPISLLSFDNLPKVMTTLYANTSFPNRTLELPNIMCCEKFREAGYAALWDAHQRVKAMKLPAIKVQSEPKNIVFFDVPNDLLQVFGQTASERYFAALEKMRGIKKTGMTFEWFKAYAALGEMQLNELPAAFEEWKRDDQAAHIEFEAPPVIPCVTELADMYLRWGHWDDAFRVIERGREVNAIDKEGYTYWKEHIPAVKDAATKLMEILESTPESIKQTALVKKCENVNQDALKWVLRYYKGIIREKMGSTYLVSLNTKSRIRI